MSFTPADLETAHRRSLYQRAEIERSEVCGCFYCRRTLQPDEIVQWTDGETTAWCPHCGIDSVLGSASGFPVTSAAFLDAMHRRWFENAED
jgi:Zn finger protein HypA/HybF involved in hydrogenase expression